MNHSTPSPLNQEHSAAGGHGNELAHPARGGGDPSEGAPPSNTAPSTCNSSSGTQILRIGIDSLYLSYHGQLYEETGIRLKELKSLAQSRNPERVKLAQTAFGGHVFKVHDRGARPYEFVVSDRWYRIQIAGLDAERLPLAHVKIASEALTLEGPRAVVSDLTDFVGSLGPLDDAPTVSRADLCVDFVTDTTVADFGEDQFVTRARKFARYSVGHQFSGLSIGLGGDLSARLYNKPLEIQTSGKDYMYRLWRIAGWDGSQPVWRLEFQFGRETLRQLGVYTFDDLQHALGGLWAYATADWLRLTLPNAADSTQSRWPTHPLWSALQGVDWGTEAPVTRRTAPKSTTPSDNYLFQQGIGAIISFAAREGITTALDGFSAFFDAAEEFHNARTHRTGQTFDEFFEQKVALKMREFGTFANSPPPGERHPADEAVAKAYWRRSDGL